MSQHSSYSYQSFINISKIVFHLNNAAMFQVGSVESMGSAEDTEFEELVNQGREDHPLVKYKRLASTKKAELEYHYDPVVDC